MANKKYYLFLAIALTAMLMVSLACSEAASPENPLDEALANGRPTLAGFVGDECDCKDMRPILEQLAIEYDGRYNIVIIDVMGHKDIARQYEIMLTPTLVFFDSGGQETVTHIGAWPKWVIVEQLNEMGVV